MSDTDNSELEKKLKDIWFIARERARIDLGDPHKYVEREVIALITQQRNQARIDEAKHYHLQYAHELSHLQRGFEKNNLTDKGLGCYEALKDLDEFHKRNMLHLQAQAKETEK